MSGLTFKELLELGRKYEHIAQKLTCDHFKTSIVEECNDHRYDFITIDNVKYEVKADLMSFKTGNFYIEFLQNGKPSGIEVTHADIYIISNGTTYSFINVSVLKKLIKEKKYKCILKTRGGYNTKGYLFPVDVILQESICVLEG